MGDIWLFYVRARNSDYRRLLGSLLVVVELIIRNDGFYVAVGIDRGNIGRLLNWPNRNPDWRNGGGDGTSVGTVLSTAIGAEIKGAPARLSATVSVWFWGS